MLTILIVDDEKKERDGIELLLLNSGMAIRAIKAANGEEALACLNAEKIDILLTDIKMPFLDGIGLINRIQDQKSDIFIILYSAYADFEYAQNAIALGVHKYLLKPIEIDEFHQVINEAVEWCNTQANLKLEAFKLRKIAEDSKQYILEKQLHTLLNTSSDHPQLEQSLLQLAPEFAKLPFTPLLICSDAEILVPVIEKINSSSGPPSLVHCLMEDNTVLVCLYSGSGHDYVRLFCDHLLKSLGQPNHFTTFVIIGRELNGVTDLHEEYERLYKYTDYYYFVSSDMIMYVQKDAPIESSHDVLQILTEKIATCVKVQNFSEAYSEIEQLRLQIFGDHSYSQIFVKYILTEMIKKIAHNTSLNIQPVKLAHEIYTTDNITQALKVIHMIIKQIEAQKSDSPDQNRIIRDVKNLITQDYGCHELCLTYLADKVNVTSAYLSTLFKKETGQNISKYIADLRIEKAKHLLETTQSKVSAIGEEVGFQNSSYFISIFRNKEHLSPAQYRERVQPI
ncbi:response regulator [Paenibacillus sp. FSL L8-0463]|uniref:response regulator n=1 Tax=Paenibacillus sp. FSL L8-0463 TaxID=2954687 RepID=UPI00311A0348